MLVRQETPAGDSVVVTTIAGDDEPRFGASALASNVLTLHHAGLTFPMTLVASEASVLVSERPVLFSVVSDGNSRWSGAGQIDDRHVQIDCYGIDPSTLELADLPDFPPSPVTPPEVDEAERATPSRLPPWDRPGPSTREEFNSVAHEAAEAVGPPLFWFVAEGVGHPYVGGFDGPPHSSVTLRWVSDDRRRYVSVETNASPRQRGLSVALHLAHLLLLADGLEFPLTLTHEVIDFGSSPGTHRFDFVSDGRGRCAGMGQIAGREVEVNGNCLDPHRLTLVTVGTSPRR